MITTEMLLENTRELNILYVEDDVKLADATNELLSSYFHSVDIAYDGEEGLAKYSHYKEENNSYYDLVITDIEMPKLDGLEMSKEILRLHDSQPIVIITGYDTVAHLFESIQLGINGFIIKPIEIEQLMQTLFKVSQSIIDTRMLEIYIEQIEGLNSDLEKSTRILDTVIYKTDINYSKKITNEKELLSNDTLKIQIQQLVNDDLYELKEILNEIDVCIIGIIGNEESILVEDIEVLIKYFSKYAAILGYYTFFNDLSVAMNLFSDTIKNTPLPEDQVTRSNVFTLLESFIYVLSKWHDDLSSGDESKLNQLDASLISDMHTITNLWTQEPLSETSEEDLDDIFDF